MQITMKKTDTTSRAVALDILQGVLRKSQALDETMAHHKGLDQLEKRDRGFVHALVAMTLRRLGQIDDLITRCLNKQQDIKAPVHDILRLGIAQILFLGTPAHAAVDTSVELAASGNPTRPYKGFINAILRRLTREGEAMVKTQDAARLNTPDWLWTSWRKNYGVAKAREIALAHLAEALIDISPKADPALWAERLGGTLLPTGSVRLGLHRLCEGRSPEAIQSQKDQTPVLSDSGLPRASGARNDGEKEDHNVKGLEGFTEGAWWVQDAAAALPVMVMGDVKGKLVFDLCAAPGGKAMQLAAAGAKVTAVDRSAKRLERLKENLQRLKLDVDVFCTDALAWKANSRADIVLLDAPCSATGTIRRHPDVQRLKGAGDVVRMMVLQEKLLNRAAQELLAPGGMLVYAVCSLQAEEAEDQIEKFLAATPAFARNPIMAEEIGGAAELITAVGDIRCLPCHWPDQGGMDGFFVARLVKK